MLQFSLLQSCYIVAFNLYSEDVIDLSEVAQSFGVNVLATDEFLDFRKSLDQIVHLEGAFICFAGLICLDLLIL